LGNFKEVFSDLVVQLAAPNPKVGSKNRTKLVQQD